MEYKEKASPCPALGLSVGSSTLGLALADRGKILHCDYRMHHGLIRDTLRSMLEELPGRPPSSVCVTGSGAHDLHSCVSVTDSVAILTATRYFHPGCDYRSILYVGGEAYRLIELDAAGEFLSCQSNTSCASGTGSFLEQQAKRLQVGIEELCDLAETHVGKIPSVATRCSVFAKSDLIHFMQEGYQLPALCAGLSQGVALNILDALNLRRRVRGRLVLVGGVSRNRRVVATLASTLGVELLVHPEAHLCKAIGAALCAGAGTCSTIDPWSLLQRESEKSEAVHPPLTSELGAYPDFSAYPVELRGEVEVTRYAEDGPRFRELFLGLDIGSTSTKLVVTDPACTVLLGLYTKTKGDPVRVSTSLLRLTDELLAPGGRRTVVGLGTTGSGRKLIASILGADRAVNEISAHARAAAHLFPAVDTLVEIGGQDSKFTLLQRGQAVQSVMNYVCAAGTGSFLEEQAQKLGVPLTEFADRALGKTAPVTSDRCTVYMERDLNRLLARGWSRDELLAATVHSIRDNYLRKVVGQLPIGSTVCFQGATARNKALVAAFEQGLGKTIHVSPFCHLSGALGVCLELRDRSERTSSFVGFDALAGTIVATNEQCNLCRNRCELTVVELGEHRHVWGTKCGREYDERRRKGPPAGTEKPTLAALVEQAHQTQHRKRAVIGLPRALMMHEHVPLWQDFLQRLECEVVVPPCSVRNGKQGKDLALAEFCSPMLEAHAQVAEVLEKGVEYVFLPTLVSEHNQAWLNAEWTPDACPKENFFCYYTLFLPVILKNNPHLDLERRLLTPAVDFRKSSRELATQLHQSLGPVLGVGEGELHHAFDEAFWAYQRGKAALRSRGRQQLQELATSSGLGVVFLGRPYTVLNPAANPDLEQLFAALGCTALWQDSLTIDPAEIELAKPMIEDLHWHFGRKILAAAEFVARQERLFPVLLTNFRCSPDAFVQVYFKQLLEAYGKPYLILQLDELGSDVGYQTRIEAAVATFRGHTKGRRGTVRHTPYVAFGKDRTYIMPNFEPLGCRLAVAQLRSAGYKAELALETKETIRLGLTHALGCECLPASAIVGSIVHTVRELGLDPHKTAYFAPLTHIACNFPQFPKVAAEAFAALGLDGLSVYRSELSGGSEGMLMTYGFFRAFTMGALLRQMAHRVRPYEREPGQTDHVCAEGLTELEAAFVSRGDAEAVLLRLATRLAAVPVTPDRGKRPLVAIIGDLYVKYNEVFNDGLERVIESSGCEVFSSPVMDMLYVSSTNGRELALREKQYLNWFNHSLTYNLAEFLERRLRRLCAPLLEEPEKIINHEDLEAALKLGITPYQHGETPMNLVHVLHLAAHGRVAAFVHVNPLFCCPGAVSQAVFPKVAESIGRPIINLFYDGLGNPGDELRTHLHFLVKKLGAMGQGPRTSLPPMW